MNQQQTQHVSAFTTELFAHYLHIICLLVMKCRQFTQNLMSSTDAVQRFNKSMSHCEQPFTADVLYLKLIKMSAHQYHYKPLTMGRQKSTTNLTELDTSELVELLQQSAVENFTIYRQLERQKFISVVTIATTDFEVMYAYKRGDYRRCLQLSTQNVRTLWYAVYITSVLMYPEFIQLLDDDIVSMTAMTLIAYSDGIREES